MAQVIARAWVGQTMRATCAFSDPSDDDAAVDPTTVQLEVFDPDGALSVTRTYAAGAVTKDSAGNYSATWDASAAGDWTERWEGVKDGKTAVAERTVRVRASKGS